MYSLTVATELGYVSGESWSLFSFVCQVISHIIWHVCMRIFFATDKAFPNRFDCKIFRQKAAKRPQSIGLKAAAAKRPYTPVAGVHEHTQWIELIVWQKVTKWHHLDEEQFPSSTISFYCTSLILLCTALDYWEYDCSMLSWFTDRKPRFTCWDSMIFKFLWSIVYSWRPAEDVNVFSFTLYCCT